MTYWTEFGDLGNMTGRSFGATIIALIGLGYLYMRTHPQGLPIFLRIVTAFNIINTAMFAWPAYFGPAVTTANTKMWEVQLALNIPILLVGLPFTGLSLFTPKFAIPACRLDKANYCFVNLLFFTPFVLGFLIAPNYLFGPSSPGGMPMFLVELNEAAIWFGKAWAIGCGLLVLGPYLFGVGPGLTSKQLLFAYTFNIGLFVYAIMNYSVLNIMMVGPMTGLNVLFLIWNIKVVIEEDKKGDRFIPSLV